MHGSRVCGCLSGRRYYSGFCLIHQCLLDAEKEEAVEERRRDYKTALQELVQRQADQVLVYQVVGEQGPDHAKTFEAEVLLNGTPLGTGCGHSKKKPNRLRRNWP